MSVVSLDVRHLYKLAALLSQKQFIKLRVTLQRSILPYDTSNVDEHSLITVFEMSTINELI